MPSKWFICGLLCVIAVGVAVGSPLILLDEEALDHPTEESLAQIGADTFLNPVKAEEKTVKQRIEELQKKVTAFKKEQKKFMEKVLHPAVVNIKVESGPKGLEGKRGKRGPDGARGYSGRPGPIGRRGPRGDVGKQGPDGNQGPMGERGIIGVTGKQGGKGDTGEEGPRGGVGLPGLPGPRGAPGPAGQQGLRGMDGAPGAPGNAATGMQGPRGAPGVEGPPGPPGVQGPVGQPGPGGVAGARGPTGPIGAVGAVGARGRSGAVTFQFPDRNEEQPAEQRIPGAFAQLWYLPDNTPNLNLAWGKPMARFIFNRQIFNIGSPSEFDLPNHRLELFAIRYTGIFYAPRNGVYYFWTASDDGSKFYVNNNLVVNNDGLHGTQWAGGGAMTLTEGTHRYQLDFFQNYGGGSLYLDWQGPGFNRERMPVFQPPPAELNQEMGRPMAVYGQNVRFFRFNHDIGGLGGLFNGNPSSTMRRDDPFINIMDRNNFGAGVVERFAAEYTGKIWAPISGRYNFWSMSDDGSQVFIDGALVVNNDGLHGNQWRDGPKDLSAGAHDIKVLFFQNGGGGTLRVDWAGPGFGQVICPIMLSV